MCSIHKGFQDLRKVLDKDHSVFTGDIDTHIVIHWINECIILWGEIQWYSKHINLDTVQRIELMWEVCNTPYPRGFMDWLLNIQIIIVLYSTV